MSESVGPGDLFLGSDPAVHGGLLDHLHALRQTGEAEHAQVDDAVVTDAVRAQVDQVFGAAVTDAAGGGGVASLDSSEITHYPSRVE